MQAKEAKDLTKAAKDKKVKDKDDYDKLSEAEKQVIRDELIAEAQPIIDNNIRDMANAGNDTYSITTSDPLLSKMDATAIAQLTTIYTTPGQGNKYFTVTSSGEWLVFGWVEA